MYIDHQPKSDLIMDEIKRRLRADPFFEKLVIYEGSGGVWGTWSQTLPCVHIFELLTDREKSAKGRGIYLVKIPIQLEYVTKLVEKNKLFTEGRKHRFKMQKAIELDEFFTQGRGTDSIGNDLVVDYGIKFEEIVEAAPGIIDCAIQWEFTFTERFFGYKQGELNV